MKIFQRGDAVRIKNLNELKYAEQDELATEDFKKLGLKAVFMFYEEDGNCVVSVERNSYSLPEWLIKKDESESLISRPFRVETYKRTNHKELIERIAYLTSKTTCKFSVEQYQNETILKIEA